MREHQIAISLKPQQFELLQRLARERGFRSVTAYVKQKIVELALGVDSDLPAVGTDGMQYGGAGGGFTVENQTLVVDLTRIHNELRAFVGRSLEDEIAAGSAAAASASALAFELPPPGQNMTAYGSGESMVGTTPYSTPSSYSSSSPSPASAPFASDDGEAVSSQVLPSSNLGGFGFKLGGFAGGNAASRFQAPLDNADRLSGYREIMDDLEELADRAFAISPRLGALDEEAPGDTATERGGRSGANTIFVEPILPAATNAPGTNRPGPANPAAPPQAKPINMVQPISAADLPGPSQLAAEEARPSTPAAKGVPALSAPQAQAVPAVPAVPAAPEVAAIPAIPAVPAVPAAPEVAAIPAVLSAPESVSAPEASAEIDQPTPPMVQAVQSAQIVSVPLPGDDLLSELLDESLVAHAETPRPADNPFALDRALEKGSTAGSTVDSAAVIDATAGVPHVVDPQYGDEQSAAEMDQQLVDELTQEPKQEPRQEPVQESGVNHTLAPSESENFVPAAVVYNDLEDEERQKQSASQSGSLGQVRDEPQDPSPPGHTNVSGGPPPKRRRT